MVSSSPEARLARLDALVSVRLWAVAEAFQARLSAELVSLGLTVPAFRLVGEVMRSPGGLRPSELAKRLGVRAPTISAAVAKLEARGVVTREDDPDDPRAYRVCLAEGAPLLEGVEILERIDADLVEGLDADRIGDLLRLLEHAHGQLTTEDE